MAIQHAIQAQDDLNAIRGKAGLPASKPTFFLASPGAEPEWPGSNGVSEMRARQRARAAALVEQPAPPPNPLAALTPSQLRAAVAATRREPSISTEVMATLAATGRRERGEPDPQAPPVKVNADDILRAAAKAKGLLIELPPAGSPARQILEAAAKRRSETLDGKPL